MNRKGFINIVLIILIVMLVGVAGYLILVNKQTQPLSNLSPTFRPTPTNHGEIPDSIIRKSNEFIISQVGKDFFDKYISIDYGSSEFYPPDEFCIENPTSCLDYLQKSHYLMVYSFKIPEKAFVNEFIEFAVDIDGNVIFERDVIGIPQCLANPKECYFPVDEQKAISIAKDAGLEQGIKAWETDFHWYGGDLKTYVWTVSNTLSESLTPGFQASGKSIVIDANSGEVIMISEWQTIE
ncbi:MAG: hypothetical protein QME57_00400 [Patescibacteria group bacterium]|nr:hypothetical protein [Patescibacteria group bacterium]